MKQLLGFLEILGSKEIWKGFAGILGFFLGMLGSKDRDIEVIEDFLDDMENNYLHLCYYH